MTRLPILALTALLVLAGCAGAAPDPTSTPVERTVVVHDTEVVERTVVVNRTVTVEKTVVVERTVVVTPTATATPEPTAVPTPVPTATPTLEEAIRVTEVELWRDVKEDGNDTYAYELRAVVVNDAGRDANVTLEPAIRFGTDGRHYTSADVDRRTVTVPAGESVRVIWNPVYEKRLANASGSVEVVGREWVG